MKTDVVSVADIEVDDDACCCWYKGEDGTMYFDPICTFDVDVGDVFGVTYKEGGVRCIQSSTRL